MDGTTIGFVIISVIVLLVLARWLHQLMLGQSITGLLIEQDNRAVAIALGGFLLGVVNVIIPVLSGDSHSFWRDVIGVCAYGIGGILAMTFAGWIFALNSKWMGLDLRREIESGNDAAGLVAGAEYLAASQIVSGALTGDGAALMPTVVFWLAGIAAMVLLTHMFHYLTAYDDVGEIVQGNVAAAFGYSGLLVAIGMMVGYSVGGEFTGYMSGFRGFGLMLLVTLVFYPVRQFIVQTLLLGCGFKFHGGRLDTEIAEDKNLGAGLLEAFGYLATALLVTRIF
ncbi:MAG: DUF350 domain-containing protein [Acidobacteria bacterium]|nr:DUF350 domain-containing protein [Acidobacteriota bacterium]